MEGRNGSITQIPILTMPNDGKALSINNQLIVGLIMLRKNELSSLSVLGALQSFFAWLDCKKCHLLLKLCSERSSSKTRCARVERHGRRAFKCSTGV